MQHPRGSEAGAGTERQGSSARTRGYYRRILPFYDLELAGRGDEALWLSMASAPVGARVLELGAGTGRATRFLADRAGWVVALELSLDMIAVARQRLADLRNVALVAGDLRRAAFRTRFDLVVAVDDPFVHLTEDADRDRAIANAARHLLPGGRFVLDAAWLAPDQRHASGSPEGLVKATPLPGGLEVRETWHCDPEARRCTASYEYLENGERVEKAAFPARLWSREELESRAQAAGLTVTHLWGDFDRRPWDRATSQRMIAQMRRA
jgi:SAM-dependent methyltransferase